MKMNLSDEVIAGLEPGSVMYRVTDASVPGLYITVMPSGKKALVERYDSYKYRFNKSVTLGAFGEVTYKEARKKAIEVRAKIKACKNKDEADQVVKEYASKAKEKCSSMVDGARNRFGAQIRERAIPRPHVNMSFQDGSELRHDFAWPELWIAANVVNVVNICVGNKSDKTGAISVILNKHNLARALGWSVYLVSRAMVDNGGAIELVSKAVNSAINQNEGIGYENKV